MAGGYMYGWDIDNTRWRKLAVDVNGKIITTMGDIFEDPPVNGETEKGATSNWCFDHDADVDAHHTKFTNNEHDTAVRHPLANLDPLVCSEAEADAKIETHRALPNDHHTKYTDAEALAACGLNGNQYWSIPGSSFMELDAYNAQVTRIVTGTMTVDNYTQAFIGTVNLPNGVTVTGAICYGNAAAEDNNWTLRRVKLSDLTNATLANALINTEDTDIDNATIDNSLYAYFFYTTGFPVGDILYGARITYTL